MKLQFLGHACFLLSEGEHRVLVDPYLSGNQFSAVSADEVEATMIFVTHGHGDHVGDAVAIAERTGAPIFSTVEVAGSLPKHVRTCSGNMGGRQELPFGAVKIVSAIHGSGVPGALACGFVFEIGGVKIYHAGDTALTMDMALLAEEHIDAALLPIGDYYTMGPGDALRAAKLIAPKHVIPMHYDTFPVIRQDPVAFCDAVRRELGCEATPLRPGEAIEL